MQTPKFIVRGFVHNSMLYLVGLSGSPFGERLYENLHHLCLEGEGVDYQGTSPLLTMLTDLRDLGLLNTLEAVVFFDAHERIVDVFDGLLAEVNDDPVWYQRLRRAAFVNSTRQVDVVRPHLSKRTIEEEGPLLGQFDVLFTPTSDLAMFLARTYELPHTQIKVLSSDALLSFHFTAVVAHKPLPKHITIAVLDPVLDEVCGYDQLLAIANAFNDLTDEDIEPGSMTFGLSVLAAYGETAPALPKTGKVLTKVELVQPQDGSRDSFEARYWELIVTSDVVWSMNSVEAVNLAAFDAHAAGLRVLLPNRQVDFESSNSRASFDRRQLIRPRVLNGAIEYMPAACLIPIDSRSEPYLDPAMPQNSIPKNFVPILINKIEYQGSMNFKQGALRQAMRVALQGALGILDNVLRQRMI